ncbi:hypothetical protein OSTOST_10283, partial [Ostertagia ostertagi]
KKLPAASSESNVADSSVGSAFLDGVLQRRIAASLPRHDVTVEVDELKSNLGIYSKGMVFHGYVTTSIGDRAEVVELLQSVPTITIVFLASRDSVPNRAARVMSPRLETAASSRCGHGGTQLPNNTCLCQPYTSGLQCEKVTCQNFGLNANDRCVCAPGYNSNYCENRKYLQMLLSAQKFPRYLEIV